MENFEFEFVCKRILFRSVENHFTIMNAEILHIPSSENYHNKNVIVKGIFDKVEEKDAFRCYANWVNDKKYGLQIEASMPVMIASSDIEGIKRYICRLVRGIGRVTASKIVKEYGIHTIDKIKESPANLSCIKGVSEAKAQKIHETILKSEKVDNLSVFLFRNGVSSFNDIILIYDKMGDDAQDKIIANPYSICDYLSISKFGIADKIALKNGLSPLSELRISKIIQHYLYSHCYSSGDMYILFNYLYKTLPSYMKSNGFYYEPISEELFNKVIDYMQESNQIVLDDDDGEQILYLKPYYTIEFNTSNLIKKINIRRISPQKDSIYDDFFEDLVKTTGIEPDENQKNAVRIAYENRFSVLTGGPGTGKTQTINTIISFIEKQRPLAKIVLCAPTGRASKRMSEFTGCEALTIHRLLGILGDDEYGNSYNNDLDADFVICDESSMIDSALFYKLITAIADNPNTSLLLVGDKDQLPPVGVGLPFKDIIESGKVPTVRLEKLYRQAKKSQINRNAKLILQGVTYEGGETGLSFDRTKQDFFFFETDDLELQRTVLKNSVTQLLALGTNLDDIMILSPVRKTPLGVIEINRMIQELVNPPRNSVEFEDGPYVFRVDDRVMQTSNNYELDVFNGDIGTIVSIDTEDEEIVVEFNDNEIVNGVVVPKKKNVIYSFSTAKELELAYAMTVHKSQGSEYPVAIMPISPMFSNLSRNILYTGITRAKKRCILVGDRKSLVNGIIKNDNLQRRTLLKKRI